MFQSFRQDVIYAVRSFLKVPGLSTAIVVSIGLGIAANATVFSMVNALLLRDLPVRQPGRVFALARGSAGTFSYPDYRDFRDQSGAVFEGVTAHCPFVPANLNAGGAPQRIWGQLVSGNYFSVLGVQPSMGRGILPRDDEAPGKHAVVVLGHDLWQRLGRESAMLGKTIVLSGLPYTVVGVAPPGFRGTDRIITPDFWAPLAMYAQLSPDLLRDGGESRNAHWLELAGRLKPGVGRAQALAAVNVIHARINAAHEKNQNLVPMKLQPLGQIPELHRVIVLLMSTLTVLVGLLLLIACANVANLLLARAASRQHEMGVRLAVGASRGRLVRQLLTESVLLAALGAAFGYALAVSGATLLAGVRSPLPLPLDFNVRPDFRVLTFTVVLALFTGVLFGLAPALTGTRGSLTDAIRRTAWSWGFRRGRLASLLVGLQVMLSLVLLVASGLFIRSFQKAAAIDIGMNSDNVLMLSLDAKTQGYSQQRSREFFRQLEERVTSLPGVRSMSYVDIMPLSLASNGDHYQDADRLSGKHPANQFLVGPHYFETVGIPLLHGRDFDPRRDEQTSVAVINEALARRLFGRESAIGRHIRKGEDAANSRVYEVIGVVANAKAETLGEEAEKSCVFAYLPSDFDKAITFFGVTVMVKTAGNPMGLLRAVRQQVEALDRNMPVFNTKTMADHVNGALLIPRVCAALFGLCGMVGLILAVVGLYGVISYSVRMRTREIGIRMALGAPPYSVGVLVARQGLALVGASVAIGIVIALALSRVIGSLLWGISTTDALTFVGVPTLLMAVAGVAILLPARRASRIEPMAALRVE